MCRGKRRYETRKIQKRRYNLIYEINGSWWIKRVHIGKMRDDLPTFLVCPGKATEREWYAGGIRRKAIKSNLNFSEELKEHGFTNNLTFGKWNIDGRLWK